MSIPVRGCIGIKTQQGRWAVDEKILLSPEDAANRLGVSRSVVYGLMAEGRLESLKIGRSRRVLTSALHKFVAEQLERQAVAV